MPPMHDILTALFGLFSVTSVLLLLTLATLAPGLLVGLLFHLLFRRRPATRK